jgi:Profilin
MGGSPSLLTLLDGKQEEIRKEIEKLKANGLSIEDITVKLEKEYAASYTTTSEQSEDMSMSTEVARVWQKHVDYIMLTGEFIHCGIFGIDGSTLAASSDFPVSKIDANFVRLGVAAINDPVFDGSRCPIYTVDRIDDISGAPQKRRFVPIHQDRGSFLLMKHRAEGIILMKSAQTVFIAMHNSEVKAETCLRIMGAMIDNLIKNGF